MLKYIDGGVCAPLGFKGAGIHCGFRKNQSKKDLALIYSEAPCTAAAVYTQNLVKGAPLGVTKAHLADGRAQALICNSGNANTCNANGVYIAETTCELLAAQLGIAPQDVIVASTGVIGVEMTMAPFEAGIGPLVSSLAAGNSAAVAEAIMTTDTKMKQCAVSFTLGGRECHLGGVAKGSGMIHPNMATMLVFITGDCAISAGMLQKALSADVQDSFNMISVDGDTSTNDMVSVMCNGLAGNAPVDSEGEDYDAFCAGLAAVTKTLCKAIAADGEGASKLLACTVSGAVDKPAARAAAKSVVCSALLKSAMFGADANWGRVLCAIGYSGADVDVSKIGVVFKSAAGSVEVCRDGSGVPFSEEEAKKVLSESEIDILVTAGDGPGEATAWGCDLTYEYVRINGDYRT